MRFLSLLLVFLLSAPTLQADPYLPRNQYPLTMNRLTLRPESAEVVPEAAYGFSLINAWTNTQILKPDYLIDSESVSISPVLDYGITSNFSLGIEVPIVWRGGGTADSFIESWHDFFNLPNGSRDVLPNDSYRVAGIQGDRSEFDFDDKGWGIGSVVLRAKYQFWDAEYAEEDAEGSEDENGSFKAAWLTEAALPELSSSYGQENIDIGTGLIGSYSQDWLSLHGGSSVYYFFDNEVENLRYEDFHIEGFLLSEFSITEMFGAFLGITGSSNMIKNLPGHASYQSYIDIGLNFNFESFAVDAAVREDLSPGSSSADISFILSLSLL